MNKSVFNTNERLPGNSCLVIIYYRSRGGQAPSMASYWKSDGRWHDENGEIIIEPDAWQLIPEGPIWEHTESERIY